MTRSKPRTRTDVAREYDHPWPWKVEDILRREFDRHDGDLFALARAFDCHPRTVDKWVRRFGIRNTTADREA